MLIRSCKSLYHTISESAGLTCFDFKVICILWLNGYGICRRTEYFVLQLNTTPQAAGGQDADHPPTYPVARAVYRKGNDVLVNVNHPKSRSKIYSFILKEEAEPSTVQIWSLFSCIESVR